MANPIRVREIEQVDAAFKFTFLSDQQPRPGFTIEIGKKVAEVENGILKEVIEDNNVLRSKSALVSGPETKPDVKPRTPRP